MGSGRRRVIVGVALMGAAAVVATGVAFAMGRGESEEARSVTPASTTSTATAPAPATTITTAGPVDPCASNTTGDIDGDGRPDRVSEHWPQPGEATEPLIRVCFANGTIAEADRWGGMSGFGIRDLDGDGRSEVLVGASSGSVHAEQVLVWDGEALVYLSAPDGQLTLVAGLTHVGEDGDSWGQGATLERWGCPDVDGDGRRDLQLAVGVHRGDQVEWTRTTYLRRDTDAVLYAVIQGSDPWVPDQNKYFPAFGGVTGCELPPGDSDPAG